MRPCRTERGRHEHLPRVRLPDARAGALCLLSSHSSHHRRSNVPADIQRSEQPFSPTVPSWWHARRSSTCHTQALTTHAIATPPLSPREWHRQRKLGQTGPEHGVARSHHLCAKEFVGSSLAGPFLMASRGSGRRRWVSGAADGYWSSVEASPRRAPRRPVCVVGSEQLLGKLPCRRRVSDD
jgi:hypothetical protein